MQTHSLAERPDLVDAFWSIEGDWPRFMLQDPTSDRAYEAAVTGFPQLHLVVMDGDRAVARLHAVPFGHAVDELPARGWDAAMQEAEWILAKGGAPDLTTISLIEARVAGSVAPCAVALDAQSGEQTRSSCQNSARMFARLH